MDKNTTGLPDVRVGQIWADNDKRVDQRFLRVEQISVTGARALLRRVAAPGAMPLPWSMSRTSWVKVSRMVPTSTGYRLVRDAPRARP